MHDLSLIGPTAYISSVEKYPFDDECWLFSKPMHGGG
jgi:hypothetical protein